MVGLTLHLQFPALDSSALPVEQALLSQPPLKYVAAVLEAGLRENFAEASVTVVECPDLRCLPPSPATQGGTLGPRRPRARRGDEGARHRRGALPHALCDKGQAVSACCLGAISGVSGTT